VAQIAWGRSMGLSAPRGKALGDASPIMKSAANHYENHPSSPVNMIFIDNVVMAEKTRTVSSRRMAFSSRRDRQQSRGQ
jgi:hypothetical protein